MEGLRELDELGRRSLSYAHGSVGAEGERACRNGDFAARADLGQLCRWRRGTRQARERQRLRNRLGVLELVLDDHPHDEATVEQWIAIVDRQFTKER